MPNIKSAIKRVKQNEARRTQRTSQKSALRSQIKSFEQIVANGSSDEAKQAYVQVQQKLDKAVSKGILHKNAAARKKSKLASKLNNAQ